MQILGYAALIAAFALSGCMSPAERSQQGQQAINTIRSVCNGYGLTEGTPEFARCARAQANAMYGSAPPPTQSSGGCFGYCEGGPSGATSSAPTYQQGTHTYNINGKTMTCTTTGTYTSCY